MISLKKSKHPNLKMTPMKCDDILHPKLDIYDLTKNLNVNSSNILFLGAPKSGKTSLVESFFNEKNNLFHHCFDYIYLFQPFSSNKSMGEDHAFTYLKDERKYSKLSYETLNNVFQEIQNKNLEEDDLTHCIILDDQTAFLKKQEIQELLQEIIFNRRHEHITLITIAQVYKKIPTDLRKMFSDLFIFDCSKDEFNYIWEEKIEQNKKLIEPIMKLVFDKKFNFLYYNCGSRQMFKNWDLITIES